MSLNKRSYVINVKHMINEHPNLSQPECGKCDKTFPKNCDLERQIMVNHDSKPFACEKCPKMEVEVVAVILLMKINQ